MKEKIIINAQHTDKVHIRPLDHTTHYDYANNINCVTVHNYIMEDDNYSRYAGAHTKCLSADEMMAIYEYMKNIIANS